MTDEVTIIPYAYIHVGHAHAQNGVQWVMETRAPAIYLDAPGEKLPCA
jgi:hypothetical protein